LLNQKTYNCFNQFIIYSDANWVDSVTFCKNNSSEISGTYMHYGQQVLAYAQVSKVTK